MIFSYLFFTHFYVRRAIKYNCFFYIISILNVSGTYGDTIKPANIPDTLHKISTISNTPRIKTNCRVSNNTTNIKDMITMSLS